MLADAALLVGVALILAGIVMLFGIPVGMTVAGFGCCALGLWLGVTKPADRASR